MSTIYTCGVPFGIVAARISLADACTGMQIAGSANGFVTDALDSGSSEWQLRAGTKIQKVTGDSRQGYGVDIRRNDAISGETLKLKTLKADIYLESLITAGTFITTPSGGNTEVIGWLGKTGAVAHKLVVELWEEVDFPDCSVDEAGFNYIRHVFGIGGAKPVNLAFAATDNRAMELEFDMQPFQPPTAWKGPYNDFPTAVSTAITNTLAADSAYKTTGLHFYEAAPPVAVCGLISVPAAT